MSNKKLKDATVFTVLSIVYPVYLFMTRDPESISTVSLLLAILFSFVGLVYSLNIEDARYKWGMSILNLIILGLFIYYTIAITL